MLRRVSAGGGEAVALHQDIGNEWEALLALAGGAFGLRLSPSGLERPMRSARILPPVADLPLAPPPDREFHIGNDPVLDLLLNRADRAALKEIVAASIRRLIAETGLVELADGITTHFIDGLLCGAVPNVRINDARNLLSIRA